MNTASTQNRSLDNLFPRLRPHRGLAFGMIILAALLAFEIFNYSTTDFALADLLGNLSFLGLPWSTILAIAFCGIDFAGIARLFTPEEGANEPNEIWYLFGAWLLAATMNAMLTWWGVSIAVLEHQSLGDAVVARGTLLRVVPVFVAVLVWLIRVLIIGTFSVAGERLFSQSEQSYTPRRSILPVRSTQMGKGNLAGNSTQAAFTPLPTKGNSDKERVYARPEPTYQPASLRTSSYPQQHSSQTST
jgi:hypothetical protein